MAVPNIDETFDLALNPAIWTIVGTPAPSAAAGVLTLPTSVTGCYISSVATGDLTGAQAVFSMISLGTGPGYQNVHTLIRDAGNRMDYSIQQNAAGATILHPACLIGGMQMPMPVMDVMYDPSMMLFTRMRETNGYLMWEYSQDGVSWTHQHTMLHDGLPMDNYQFGVSMYVASGTGGTPSLYTELSFLPTPPPGDADGFYSVVLHNATAGVSAGLLGHAEPGSSGTPAAPLPIVQAAFEMSIPMLEDGVLTDTPALGALVSTVAGVGAHDYNDQSTDPLAINTSATARWIAADPNGFQPAVSWAPTQGDATLLWLTDGLTTPVYDPDYVYDHLDRQAYHPALVFDGGAYMQLNTPVTTVPAATLVVVAVLSAGLGAHYGVIESLATPVPPSSDPGADPLPPAPRSFGLRYSHGQVQVWAGAPVMTHDAVVTIARPVIMALTVDAIQGQLMVVDRTRSTRTFSTDGFGVYNAQLQLGRVGNAEDASTNAVMDVLEVLYYNRALPFGDLEALLADLDAAYGVS